MQVSVPAWIGVLGDTHLTPSRGRAALDAVMEVFRRAKVSQILHTGDVGHESVLRELESIAPVAAVRGNADPHALIEVLPDQIWIEAGNRIILLLHGHRGKTALKAARAAAAPEIDMIVFGHSHQPLIDREGETILFNPGSPTERRWNPHFGFGWITLTDAVFEPELVLFDDPRHLENVKP